MGYAKTVSLPYTVSNSKQNGCNQMFDVCNRLNEAAYSVYKITSYNTYDQR